VVEWRTRARELASAGHRSRVRMRGESVSRHFVVLPGPALLLLIRGCPRLTPRVVVTDRAVVAGAARCRLPRARFSCAWKVRVGSLKSLAAHASPGTARAMARRWDSGSASPGRTDRAAWDGVGWSGPEKFLVAPRQGRYRWRPWVESRDGKRRAKRRECGHYISNGRAGSALALVRRNASALNQQRDSDDYRGAGESPPGGTKKDALARARSTAPTQWQRCAR
jgi:hypothetical protein